LDIAYSGAQTILQVLPLNPNGIFSDSYFLTLDLPLNDTDVLPPVPQTVAPFNATAIKDRQGLDASIATHSVSDLLLGVVEPVWASNGDAVSVVRNFSGSASLDLQDVTVQAQDLYSAGIEMRYDVGVSPTLKQNGVWLPSLIPGLVPAANTGASAPLAPFDIQGQLNTFLVPEANLEADQLEFVFQVGTMYAVRVINPKDPRTLALWSLEVQTTKLQRGSVVVKDNVLRPALGGTTKVVYTLAEQGNVTVIVSDVKGDIVDVLVRGVQAKGEHIVEWTGKNRGRKIVAPGLYFVKIVGPGINEVRKVLVAK
jgi:hypothetical protein